MKHRNGPQKSKRLAVSGSPDQRRHLVFIDDDPWETKKFKELFGDRFRVTTVNGRNAYEAAEKVAQACCDPPVDLFVLDMYFSDRAGGPTALDPAQKAAAVSAAHEVASQAERFAEVLDDAPRALREGQALVDRASAPLREVCEGLGQSPSGGIALMKMLEARYPGVPKIFYSRKATFPDAKRALAAGALDVLIKPNVANERQAAAELAQQFALLAERRPPSWALGPLRVTQQLRTRRTATPKETARTKRSAAFTSQMKRRGNSY